MVPEAMSDTEMILHTMICCGGIMRWYGRRKLNVDGHAFPKMDLAEILEYVALPYHKDFLKPRDLDIFTQGLARIGAEPTHIENQCMRLGVETGNNTKNALEPEYNSKEESGEDSMTVEPDIEPRDFSS